MPDMWLEYERKRNSFEKKWLPRIRKVLNKQLVLFIAEYKKGNPYLFGFEEMLPVLMGLYKEVGGRFGRETFKELRTERKFLGIGFNEDFAQDVIERLRMSGLSLAVNMSNTTMRQITRLLVQATEQNLSLDDTVRLIKREMGAAFEQRARVITRTEVGRAANLGKMSGAVQMGIAMDKIWLTANDERVRRRPRDKGDHLELHDKPGIELDETFKNGLTQPGDPNGKPEETINCRCTLVFKAKRDRNGLTIPKKYY